MLAGGNWNARSVESLNIWTGELGKFASMGRERVGPGVIAYARFVWMFGGDTNDT